ncbi:MAG: DUF2391 family protein [Candidatus Woesearchaeota archaeon]
MRELEQIKRELDVVKFETDLIKNDVERIKDKLIDHTPEHFSNQDFIRASIGALFLGFSVLFSANLISLATKIPTPHLYIIVIGTLLILTLEIYIIGYSRVSDKFSRGFGQFWIKRLMAFYITAVAIAVILSFTFGVHYLIGAEDFISLIIILSAPCAIGASLGDLLKKY